jgi:hypothetical protein
MRKVFGSSPPIDLSQLINFVPSVAGYKTWVITEIEYGGVEYLGKSPEEFERESASGISMRHSEFEEFNTTVNQVYEGFFELWVAPTDLPFSVLILIVMLVDGEFWRISGSDTDNFMDQIGLRFY